METKCNMKLNRLSHESSPYCFLHDMSDAVKTFTKVWGNTAWLSANTKSNVFVGTTANLQTGTLGMMIVMLERN